MKACNTCHATLPLEAFHRNSRRLDGHEHRCKACANAYKRQHAAKPEARLHKAIYRLTNVEKFNRWSAAYRAKHPDRVLATRHRYVEQNAEKRKARTAVSNAIRDGKLVRLPCGVCGAKAEAHHADYSKPLDVVWLCKRHHSRIHASIL
jgi:hypothetical protein